jgi:outer membrane protein assembly factor BamB
VESNRAFRDVIIIIGVNRKRPKLFNFNDRNSMRRILVPAVSPLLLVAAASAAFADNPNVSRNDDRTVRGYDVVWSQPIGTDAGSLVVLPKQKKLLVGTDNGAPRSNKLLGDRGVLMCFHSEDGAFLWQATHPRLPARRNDMPGTPLGSIPFVEGDRVYYVSNRGELVCLDLQGFHDGKNDGPFRAERETEPTDADIVWSLDMVKTLGVDKRDAGDMGNPTPSPLVLGDHVYCVTGNGGFFGTPNWRVPAPKAPSFLAVHRGTGQVAWSSNAPGDRIIYGQWSSPVACALDGRSQVIFTGGDGFAYSFAPTDGKLQWKLDCNPAGATEWSRQEIGTKCFCVTAPSLVGESLVVPMSQDYEMSGRVDSPITCIDLRRVPSDGKQAIRWTFRANDFTGTMSRMAVAGRLAFALDTTGHLVALSIDTGRVQWRRDLGDQPSIVSSPAINDGKLYVACGQRLTAFTADGEGRSVGRWDFNELLAGTPVVQGDRAYVTTRTKVMALRLR